MKYGTKRQCGESRCGQALIGGVILVFLGLAITAGTLMFVTHTHRATLINRSWVNSLHVAEAGVEVAINEFYKEVSGVPPWIGWSNVTANGRVKAFMKKPLIPAGVVGETNRFYSVVANLDTFTVTATGTVTLAQFTNGMQRALQVKLEPDYTSPFSAALLAKSYVKHGGNASVDSFDSSDPTKSTNGQYDPLKRQLNGDIVTVCSDPEAAIFATGSGVLYGDLIAGIGGGVKISGSYTNLGAVGSGADTDISDVIVPMSTALTDPAIKMAGADVVTINVAGNRNMSIGYIKATGGALKITGSGRLRLYVEGETSISGSATMHITPSPAGAPLAVEIYANGDVLLNSCVNQTGNAANLGIFGTKNCKSVKYTGDSHFTGFMYVPYAAYDFSGQGDFLGAVVAGTIDVTGTGDFHYDEALSKKSMPFLLGYRILNWDEI